MMTNTTIGRLRVGLFAIAVAGAGACASSKPPTENPAAEPNPEEHGMADMQGMPGDEGPSGEACPMAVEGAKVVAEDTADGVALVFTTSTGDVADLRDRVHRMAEMHERGEAQEDGMHGGGMMAHEQAMKPLPPADLTVTDIEGGARIEMTPRDPSTLSALRDDARMHADSMRTGSCPMMGEDEHEHEHGT
jgi:hypothetical protein